MSNKIKKGDTVQILAGKDKGKKGKIIQILPVLDKVVVEQLNKMKKHVKSKQEGKKGQIVEIAAPIHISNIALVCARCEKPTRIAWKKDNNNIKQRICAKCKEIIS